MANLETASSIASISGKLSSREHSFVCVVKRTGRMYISARRPVANPRTDKQVASRTDFKSKAAAASAWWRANKPSDLQPDGTPEWRDMMRRFKSQHKYGNAYTFVRAQFK